MKTRPAPLRSGRVYTAKRSPTFFNPTFQSYSRRSVKLLPVHIPPDMNGPTYLRGKQMVRISTLLCLWMMRYRKKPERQMKEVMTKKLNPKLSFINDTYDLYYNGLVLRLTG